MNQNNKTFEENMQRLEQIIRAMERGLGAFFNSLEDPRQAAAAVERAYQDYLKQYPAI